ASAPWGFRLAGGTRALLDDGRAEYPPRTERVNRRARSVSRRPAHGTGRARNQNAPGRTVVPGAGPRWERVPQARHGNRSTGDSRAVARSRCPISGRGTGVPDQGRTPRAPPRARRPASPEDMPPPRRGRVPPHASHTARIGARPARSRGPARRTTRGPVLTRPPPPRPPLAGGRGAATLRFCDAPVLS